VIRHPCGEIYQTIDKVAKSDATVLITGETGTGKELCAYAIHQESLRRDKPYIVFNCAAIPADLMESQLFGHVKGAFTGADKNRVGAAAQADGGTLFLDEIGEMDLELQGKLLRFVETNGFHKVGSDQLETVDIRFLWATNRHLPTEIKAGRFREDLYYRLKTIPIQLPPLRDRGDDVLLLAQAFLTKYSQPEKKFNNGFDQLAEKLLLHYKWPGNVRQLQKCIEGLVLLNEGEKVTSQMLLAALTDEPFQIEDTTTHPPQPALLNPTVPTPKTSQHSNKPIRPLWQTERETILDAIKYCHGNVVKAAESLQISKSYIYKKLKQWKEEDKKYQAGKKRRKNVISNA
jgi:two-component system repressor protein LuxO